MAGRRLLRAELAKALGVPEAELFGDQQSTIPSADAGFTVISHQMVPVFVGAHVADRLMKDPAFGVTSWEWTRLASRVLDHPTGSCTAYVVEWGVVVFHISHQLQLPNVAALATWRKNARDSTFAQGTTLVRELLNDRNQPGGPG